MKNIALLFLVFAILLTFEKAKGEEYPIVKIRNWMTIIGRVKTTVDIHKTYHVFYAIPYATPPIGELRFKAPLPLQETGTNKVINSSYDGCVCVQLFPSEGGCEDCLYLNVYKPHFRAPSVLLPVMVWIHGGAYVYGDSKYTSYGPDFLINENVMVVTLNYRLGVFGFLSTEDDIAPGNYGIKDQVLALQWIHENIIYFGGNPDRVTLFGESAGSSSVSYLAQFPVTKGLFQGVIMESGTNLCPWSIQVQPLRNAQSLAKLLDINTTSPETMIDGLRKVDYETVQAAQELLFYKIVLLHGLDGLPLAPVLEPPSSGALITRGNYDLIKKGKFHKVPYLLGYNALEVNSPVVTAVIGEIYLSLMRYNFKPEEMVPIGLNIRGSEVMAKVTEMIRTYYFNDELIITSEKEMIKFLSETWFVRPITKSAQFYAQYAPAYFYVFSYVGRLGSGNSQEVGHSEELPYIWNIKGKNNATLEDLKVRHRMVKFWTNFAKFGNPTPFKDSSLDNVIWPTINTNDNFQYLDIGRTTNVSINPNWDSLTFWTNLFDDFQNPPYITY
ncbi:hypothetical protein RI129_001388 [Pyrocoelia pectoralis]|uniref:Carboxylic ester hydrolase n=1 Tax=Pyrocoelia pectoralis TaxID=417401 RepID=A0AAN7VY28_9COLE